MSTKIDYKNLADSYFDHLAERFPVMCASDEFDFLPRAENASKHYDKLDDFGAGARLHCGWLKTAKIICLKSKRTHPNHSVGRWRITV